jgi:hypothetical protein
MRTPIGVVLAAGLAAIGLGFWLHNLAHLEFLPIQQIEDQSLIFTEAER